MAWAPPAPMAVGTNVSKQHSPDWSSSQRKGENVMKTLISIFALTLALAFTVPAFAGDVTAAKKAEEQCQKDGGNWDAKSKTCSGKY